MKKIITCLTGAVVFGLGVLSPSRAQVEAVEIRVDGLACPFCAYGLEKKLKDLEGVGNVQIHVDEGVAVLKNKKGESIAVEKLESVVKNAGFTPREMKGQIVGKLGRKNDAPVFRVDQSNVEFILKEDEGLKDLQSELKGADRSVRIHGRLIKKRPEGHSAHPLTLIIEKFEVVS